MLLEIIWIISIILITYKYDIALLNSTNKMSENYHFVIFSCLIIYCLNIFYKTFLLKRKKESFIWVIFITTMSVSCRNQLGDDIDTFNFILYSLIVFYLIYIYRIIVPKEETFVAQKMLIVILIVLKILWPTIVYLWPYGSDYPDDFDWTHWPDIYF